MLFCLFEADRQVLLLFLTPQSALVPRLDWGYSLLSLSEAFTHLKRYRPIINWFDAKEIEKSKKMSLSSEFCVIATW